MRRKILIRNLLFFPGLFFTEAFGDDFCDIVG